MKILFLVIAILGSVFSASGQLEVSLNDNSGFTSENRIKIRFSVTNLYPVDTFFYWAYETLPEEPTDWYTTTFYDQITCWANGVKNTPCEDDLRNAIKANETYPYFMFDLYTEDMFEEGCITLHLLSDCVEVEHDTMVSHTFKFNKDWPTRVEEMEASSQVQIYPNPATDQIYLSNDAMVSLIRIFDIQGRLVYESNHSPRLAHGISDLDSGSYNLELQDILGETLDLVRLVKVE